MILLDLNQVCISNLMAQLGNHTNTHMDEELLRHMVLNTIRSLKTKFKDWGELVICCDDKKVWRKDIFPYYKANRKKARDESELDWGLIFNTLNKIKQEIKDNFPYRVIQVTGAEADDVIGTLAPRLSASERVLILSSDADFKQLQKYDNVKQYNPMLGIYVTSKHPTKDLKEKIIRGDKGDGIPSILSADDVFVAGRRQPPISKKKLDVWLENSPKDCLSEEEYRNYIRNDTLINFDNIPTAIKENIIKEYDESKPSTKQKLYKYFVENKLISLLECIEDF